MRYTIDITHSQGEDMMPFPEINQTWLHLIEGRDYFGVSSTVRCRIAYNGFFAS